MERDLRKIPLYREVEGFFRRALEPAFGRISGATDPAPSPDGRLVAFTGSKVEKLEGVPATRVCWVDVESGEMQEATGGPNSDRMPKWSPDGGRLAFLSDRAEEDRHQLYLLDRERLGEAVRCGTVDGSAEWLAWSPDGGRILLGVAGRGAELAGVQGSGTTKEEEQDLPAWIPTVERSSDREGWRRLWVYDVESRSLEPRSREGLNVWEGAWCGGDQVVAVVSEEPGEDAWYTAPLAMIDLESGKERILYQSDVQVGLPAASSSGARLAAVEALCSDRLVVAGDVLLFDPEGPDGDPRRVDTGGVDVTHIAWRDEDRLLFAGIRGVRVVVGEIDAASGIARELWDTDESCGFVYPEARPLGSDDAFAVVVDSHLRHPEVAVVRDGRVEAVTSLAHEGSAYLDGVAGAIETITWLGKGGLEIEGLLIRPGGDGGGPVPLVTWVHGGPVGATRNRRFPLLALLASRGYAVLMPNPRGSSGRAQSFARMVYGDMGGGDADDILAGVDAMVERGIADPARLGVIGGSYGGFMSAWLVSRTDRFAAAVAISPVTDWYSQHLTSNIGFWDGLILEDRLERAGGEYFARSPVMFASKVRTPTLLTAGVVDECTPPGQAVEFYRALKEHGVEAELAIYPGEGHGVRKMPALFDFYTRMVGWFERHMPATPSAP